MSNCGIGLQLIRMRKVSVTRPYHSSIISAETTAREDLSVLIAVVGRFIIDMIAMAL